MPEPFTPELFINSDGTLKPQVPHSKMPTEDGQLHLLVPNGIGDFAWVYAKYATLIEQGKDVTFWFNDDEAKRVKPYADMLGVKYDFCTVDNRDLLAAPGELSEESVNEGGIYYVHANRHLESGKKLVDWHPWLEMRNPAPTCIVPWDKHEGGVFDFITVHMCMKSYVEGNWPEKIWARKLKEIEEKFGSVCVVGALWDVPFAHKVFQHYQPTTEILGAPLRKSLDTVRTARAHIGLDSGLTILAKYLGVPALQAFPDWLWTDRGTPVHPNGTHMPGTYDMDFHPLSENTHVADLMDDVCPWLEKVLK